MSDIEYLLLAALTVGLIAITWQLSVKAGRLHGLYRFFAFESIVLLALLNWKVWFLHPLAWNQIISWIFLTGSLFLAFEGYRLLRMVGKPQGQFENTTRLVKVGAYKYIRHPLYASLILVGGGIFFKEITMTTMVLLLVDVVAIVSTARREEKEMLEKFGRDYEEYMRETKMFIPYTL